MFLLYFCLALLSGCVWEGYDDDRASLPLDDSLYPYAGIPRVVVEIEDFREIRDVNTWISAKMQIYGEKKPETKVYALDIHGRGNSSFTAFKYGYTIRLNEKESILGMPEARTWALLPNTFDKSFLRNEVAFTLAEALGTGWVPRRQFIELYVNRDYKGVYQLVEKIKVGQNRLNLPGSGYLVEFDRKYRDDEQVAFSQSGMPFRIHDPENLEEDGIKRVVSFVDSIENALKREGAFRVFEEMVDVETYIKYYWIQEFSKNADGNFNTSVFFTWMPGGKLKMGPLWDFDAAYGAAYETNPRGWYIRNFYWNGSLFSDIKFMAEVNAQWHEYREIIREVIDTVPNYAKVLYKAAQNNYKRWPILEEDYLIGASVSSYKKYEDAVEDFQMWARTRWAWIDEEIK